ncbi:MAG: hypothetical protein GY745_04855 [Actinomycetia bacterium]|nr:hypothetical protein [Actinomycetes bacterium]
MARMTKKTEKQVREHLASLPKEALVAALMDRATEDAEFRRRLVIMAAQASDEVDPAVFRRGIADALTSGSAGRRDYARTSGTWARSVDAAIDPVEELLSAGHAEIVVGITEYALGRIDTLMGRIDDSSGWFSESIIRLEALHHTACVEATPDPVKLARRLFKLDVDGDWDIFIDCAKSYADVLGEAGLAELQKLADERWVDLPPAPAWGEEDRAPGVFHLTRMMSNLAEVSGDIDARVQVMARELNHPYRFLEIAQMLDEAGRPNEAMEWAERGLDGPDDLPPHMRSDKRLDDFALERYLEQDRPDDMVRLLWRRFTDVPEVATFARLKRWTEPGGQWTCERVRALELMRADATKRSAASQRAVSKAQQRWGGPHPKPAYEDLIAVLAFDGEPEEAWRLANDHGCTRAMWHELARASEHERPLDAARVYEGEIDELIGRKQTHTYEEAVARLGPLRRLYEAAGDIDAFDDFVKRVRVRHKQKVKFLRLLAEAGFDADG